MAKQIKRCVDFEVRNINDEDRSIDFVISSEAVDTYRTVFKLDGWDLTRYNNNPIVTYNHDDWSTNPDVVIGTSELRIEDGKLIARAKFEDLENDMNELAEKVWRKIKKGSLRMASILAHGIEGSFGSRDAGEDPDIFYFRRQELFSWSVVTHGSNPDALKRSEDETKWIDSKKETTRAKFDDFDARILKLKLNSK